MYYDPLEQKYLKTVLSGKKAVNIGNVYEVFNSDRMFVERF